MTSHKQHICEPELLCIFFHISMQGFTVKCQRPQAWCHCNKNISSQPCSQRTMNCIEEEGGVHTITAAIEQAFARYLNGQPWSGSELHSIH